MGGLPRISDLTSKNAQRWRSAKVVRPADTAARRLVGAKDRYQSVTRMTGVPWFVVAVIHEREASQRWDRQLGQGDPLDKPSIHEPKGRGPFTGPDAWEKAAVDALVNCPPKLAKWTDWTSGGALTGLTAYNGYSYDEHGRPSPYIWAGTDIYDPPSGPGGKILVDHGPIEDYWPSGPNKGKRVVDPQFGCAALLIAMRAIDPSIRFADEQDTQVLPVNPPGPSAGPKAAGAIIGGAVAGAVAHKFSFEPWMVVAAVLAAAAIGGLLVHFLSNRKG